MVLLRSDLSKTIQWEYPPKSTITLPGSGGDLARY